MVSRIPMWCRKPRDAAWWSRARSSPTMSSRTASSPRQSPDAICYRLSWPVNRPMSPRVQARPPLGRRSQPRTCRTMRRIRNSERGNVLALSSWFTLALAIAGAALAEEPGKWLERMNQALTTRNYDGTFSHWQGGRVEMLRIIHRVRDGAVSERLVSLDGSGREFIRTGSNLACYLPDKRTVLVESRPAEESLLSGFPTINDQSASFYDLKEVAQTRLLGRDTHYITVMPKDEYRYGYRLWIDDKTAMPLKTQLCDA